MSEPSLELAWLHPTSLASLPPVLFTGSRRGAVGPRACRHASDHRDGVRHCAVGRNPGAYPIGQIVIHTASLEARERVKIKLDKLARTDFVGIDAFVHYLDLGPPVGRPLQYRVSGPDMQVLWTEALRMAKLLSDNPHLRPPSLDWNEPGKVMRVDINQDKLRPLGIYSADVAGKLNGIVGGSRITQVGDSIYLVDIVGRAEAAERNQVETLQNLKIPTTYGAVVPLLAFATLRTDLEQLIVWRRDRLPAMTVRADLLDDTQPATIVKQLQPAVDKFQTELPLGFKVATGGTVEESGKGQGPSSRSRPSCVSPWLSS